MLENKSQLSQAANRGLLSLSLVSFQSNKSFKSLKSLKKSGRGLSGQSGMSLIEILIVLAILGGVMAMIAQKIFGQKDKANFQQTKIMLGNVKEKLDLYNTDCGHYPQTLDGLIKQDDGCPNWGPEAYMKKLPLDAWNRPFIYSNSNGEITLKSLGKDGQEGGTGYNKDISLEDVE